MLKFGVRACQEIIKEVDAFRNFGAPRIDGWEVELLSHDPGSDDEIPQNFFRDLQEPMLNSDDSLRSHDTESIEPCDSLISVNDADLGMGAFRSFGVVVGGIESRLPETLGVDSLHGVHVNNEPRGIIGHTPDSSVDVYNRSTKPQGEDKKVSSTEKDHDSNCSTGDSSGITYPMVKLHSSTSDRYPMVMQDSEVQYSREQMRESSEVYSFKHGLDDLCFDCNEGVTVPKLKSVSAIAENKLVQQYSHELMNPPVQLVTSGSQTPKVRSINRQRPKMRKPACSSTTCAQNRVILPIGFDLVLNPCAWPGKDGCACSLPFASHSRKNLWAYRNVHQPGNCACKPTQRLNPTDPKHEHRRTKMTQTPKINQTPQAKSRPSTRMASRPSKNVTRTTEDDIAKTILTPPIILCGRDEFSLHRNVTRRLYINENRMLLKPNSSPTSNADGAESETQSNHTAPMRSGIAYCRNPRRSDTLRDQERESTFVSNTMIPSPLPSSLRKTGYNAYHLAQYPSRKAETVPPPVKPMPKVKSSSRFDSYYSVDTPCIILDNRTVKIQSAPLSMVESDSSDSEFEYEFEIEEVHHMSSPNQSLINYMDAGATTSDGDVERLACDESFSKHSSDGENDSLSPHPRFRRYRDGKHTYATYLTQTSEISARPPDDTTLPSHDTDTACCSTNTDSISSLYRGRARSSNIYSHLYGARNAVETLEFLDSNSC